MVRISLTISDFVVIVCASADRFGSDVFVVRRRSSDAVDRLSVERYGCRGRRRNCEVPVAGRRSSRSTDQPHAFRVPPRCLRRRRRLPRGSGGVDGRRRRRQHHPRSAGVSRDGWKAGLRRTSRLLVARQ